MRAWLLDNFGGLDALSLGDAPEPTAHEGEVVLEVQYAALNPADRYLAEGQYPAKPPLPHILGRDAVGTVVAIGPGVTGWSVGQAAVVLRGEVGVSRAGTFAQRVAVPAESLVVMPEGWEEREAAGATLVYLTAYQAITQWEDLPNKAIVLVTGASGGVGLASVQLALAMGHRVFGLSRDPDKGERIHQMGVGMFDPSDPHWPRQLKASLDFSAGGRRVDLAIDNIGGTLLPQVIETLGDRGRVSCIGRLAGPVPQFNTASLFFRRLRLGGVAVGSYTNAESRAAWAAVLQLLGKTGAKPLVDRVFPFEQLRQAFERLAAGPMGKVLLAVQEK